MLRRIFASFVMVTSVCACLIGGRTQTKQLPDDASISPTGDAGTGGDSIVANDCAPNDGKAVLFIANLDLPAPTCAPDGRLVEKGQRQLTVFMWGTSLPTGPGTITIQSGTSAPATASVCTSKSCTTAVSGTITFTTYSEAGSVASGRYDIRMMSGDQVTGTFSATQCHNSAMCG